MKRYRKVIFLLQQSSKDDYLFEFTTEQHEHLAKKLHSIKGLAMVSSYNSDLYEKLYSDWTKIELPVKKNNIRSGEVQEVLWFNYPIEKTQKHKMEQLAKKNGTPVKLIF